MMTETKHNNIVFFRIFNTEKIDPKNSKVKIKKSLYTDVYLFGASKKKKNIKKKKKRRTHKNAYFQKMYIYFKNIFLLNYLLG